MNRSFWTQLRSALAREHVCPPDPIVKALADNNPLAIGGSVVETRYCVLCGAIEGGGDIHKRDCPWRLAVEATYPESIPDLQRELLPGAGGTWGQP